jgi:Mrp family chromosome partitioning ATPase/capsular polysaccharide biosynthesis protein
MELRYYVGLVWKWSWLIILSVVIAGGSSYAASKASTPLYRTKTTLVVGQITESLDPNSVQIYTSQQLAGMYVQLVRREPVMQGVIDTLGLKTSWQSLAGQVSASTIPQTQLLEITVIDSDPYRAKVIADAVAQQVILQSPTAAAEDSAQAEFVQEQMTDLQNKIDTAQQDITELRQELDTSNSARQIQDLQNQIAILESKVNGWQTTYSQLLYATRGSGTNTLSVVETATQPSSPFSPNTRMNVLVAAAIGAVLAVAGAFLIEYLDDTVKTPDDITRNTNLPTLGAIARIEGVDYPQKLIAVNAPTSPIVESYRILRTNLQFSTVDLPAHTLMLSSPGPGEGKSVTLANLAVVLAQSGLRVIVVDTDLRRPVQHKIFDLPNRYGLSDALLQLQAGVAERIYAVGALDGDEANDPVAQPVAPYLQPTMVANLRVLTTGKLPPNPAELLGSKRMLDLIEMLKSDADLVLFDSPPTLVVADAAILSGHVDGVIMVNDAGQTRTQETRRAVDELRRVGANLLGVVLNRMSRRSGGYNYYYYYYYYYSGDGDKRRKKRKHGRKIFGLPWFSRRAHTSETESK